MNFVDIVGLKHITIDRVEWRKRIRLRGMTLGLVLFALGSLIYELYYLVISRLNNLLISIEIECRDILCNDKLRDWNLEHNANFSS